MSLTLHIVCVASATDVLFRHCLFGIGGRRFVSTLVVRHRWPTFCFDVVCSTSVVDVLFRHWLVGIGGLRFVSMLFVRHTWPTFCFDIVGSVSEGRRFVLMLFVRHLCPTFCFDIVCSASVADVLFRDCLFVIGGQRFVCSASVADVLFGRHRWVTFCLFGICGRRFVSTLLSVSVVDVLCRHCFLGICGLTCFFFRLVSTMYS